MKKGIFREFTKYTSLNVLGMIGLSCYILADTFFVALGMGSDGLTALNLAIPIYNFLHGSGLMVGMGGGIKYSILGGRRGGKTVFTNAIYIAVLLAVIFELAGLFFTESILVLFGAEGVVLDMAGDYLRTLLLFSPAFIANNLILCFVRNDGAPQLSMAAMITGSLSNVLLDWVFIFPCGMGMFGAALATGLAPIISLCILLVHFIKKRNGFKPVRTKPEPRLCGGIIAGGVPSLVTEVSSGIVIMVFNAIILRLEGNTGVAAYGVIANISLVVIAVYNGIAQGIQPILSRSCGEGRREDMAAVLRYALISMLAVSAAVYASVFFFTHGIAAVFNSENDAALQAIAEYGMKLYFTACPFAGFNVIIAAYFTSTEKAIPAHIISLLRGFAVIIPAAFILSAVWGTTGVWLAFPVTELLVCAAGALLFFGISRKQALAAR